MLLFVLFVYSSLVHCLLLLWFFWVFAFLFRCSLFWYEFCWYQSFCLDEDGLMQFVCLFSCFGILLKMSGVVLPHLLCEDFRAILVSFGWVFPSFLRLFSQFSPGFSQLYSTLVSFNQVMQDKDARLSWPQEGGQNNTKNVPTLLPKTGGHEPGKCIRGPLCHKSCLKKEGQEEYRNCGRLWFRRRKKKGHANTFAGHMCLGETVPGKNQWGMSVAYREGRLDLPMRKARFEQPESMFVRCLGAGPRCGSGGEVWLYANVEATVISLSPFSKSHANYRVW